MSGNSRSSCLQTAPIVSAFSLRGGASRDTSVLTAPPGTSACTCPPAARRRSGAGATSARADHERRALVGHRVEVHGTQLPGLVHLVDLGGVALALGLVAKEGAALLAVVRALGVGEAALRAVHRYSISASAGMPLPARMSVSCCTSAPLITDSPSSCFFRSRLTSSARRMSILPWRIRRLYEISCSSSVSCWMRSFSSLSESAPRSGNVSKAVLSRKESWRRL